MKKDDFWSFLTKSEKNEKIGVGKSNFTVAISVQNVTFLHECNRKREINLPVFLQYYWENIKIKKSVKISDDLSPKNAMENKTRDQI